MTIRRRVLSLILLATLAFPAAAQDYPNRTIRIIVPFGAGGPTDVYTRALGGRTAQVLQPTVMDNRPGAGTIIGTAEAAKAAPDGYTLLMMSATQTVVGDAQPQQAIQADARFRAGRAAAKRGARPGGASRAGKQPEGADRARQVQAGKTQLRFVRTGFELSYGGGAREKHHRHRDEHVPYKGSTGARNDIIPGQIDVMFDSVPTMAPIIEVGRVQALGTSGRVRSTVLPNVPTFPKPARLATKRRCGSARWRPPARRSRSSTGSTPRSGKSCRPELAASRGRNQGRQPMVMKPGRVRRIDRVRDRALGQGHQGKQYQGRLSGLPASKDMQ